MMADEDTVQAIFNVNNEKTEDEEEEPENSGASHAKAFETLKVGCKWFEKRKESNGIQLLEIKEIRDLAEVVRIVCAKRQLTFSRVKMYNDTAATVIYKL